MIKNDIITILLKLQVKYCLYNKYLVHVEQKISRFKQFLIIWGPMDSEFVALITMFMWCTVFSYLRMYIKCNK